MPLENILTYNLCLCAVTIECFSMVAALFICPKEVICVDYNAEYIDLLKRSLAGETETVRLYLACMAVAPPEHIPKLLEIQTDETDHQAIISDLLLEAVAGESADQEKLVPGVE